MIVIVGLGITLVLVLFFSAIVDRSIIGAFGAVVLLGVVIGIGGDALIDNCNERLATQERLNTIKLMIHRMPVSVIVTLIDWVIKHILMVITMLQLILIHHMGKSQTMLQK